MIRTVKSCELAHIGGCNGRLERAHLDSNFTNNDRANIKIFCKAHHTLYDNGRIDLANPVMPPFHVGSDGERRYERVTQIPCICVRCQKVFYETDRGRAARRKYCSKSCLAKAIHGR